MKELILGMGLVLASCTFLPGKNDLIEFMEAKRRDPARGLRFDGYYWAMQTMAAGGDTCQVVFPILFFPDNRVRLFGNFVPEKCDAEDGAQSVEASHMRFLAHMRATGFLEGKNSGLYRWGRYRIDRDTLRMKYFESGGGSVLSASFFVDGRNGIILPDGTIEMDGDRFRFQELDLTEAVIKNPIDAPVFRRKWIPGFRIF